jgi:hypothetical protein
MDKLKNQLPFAGAAVIGGVVVALIFLLAGLVNGTKTETVVRSTPIVNRGDSGPGS